MAAISRQMGSSEQGDPTRHTPLADPAGERMGADLEGDAISEDTTSKRGAGRRLPTALSEADLQRLLAAPNVGCITGLRDRVMMEVMAHAGLRVSEVVALKRTDITWGGASELPGLRIDDGKGDVDRTVPIDRELVGWLRRWDEARYSYCRASFFHTVRATKTGAVSSGKHEPLSTRTVQAMVKRHAAQAGLETEGRRRVTPHVLRHTYASRLLQRPGMNLEMLRKLLGHADVSTTQIYTHISDPDLAAAVWRIGEEKQAQQTLDGQPSAADLALARALAALPADVKSELVRAITASE